MKLCLLRLIARRSYTYTLRDLMTDGTRIRMAREERDLTLAQAGKRLGITPQAWQQWEVGTRSPNMKTAHKIAEALDLSLSDLLRVGDE